MTNEMKPERIRIRKAFRELRKQGILAHMAFACCSSCGHYELSNRSKPYCFWNRQSEASSFTLTHRGTKQKVAHLVHNLCIQFSDIETANKLVAALLEQQLTVDWNGTQEKAVCVQPDPQPDTQAV